MVYPWKKSVPDHLRLGAVPNTLFSNSQSGWITKEIYLELFKWFVQSVTCTGWSCKSYFDLAY